MTRWPSKSYEKFCAIVQGRRRARGRKGERKEGGREGERQRCRDRQIQTEQDRITLCSPMFSTPLASFGCFRTQGYLYKWLLGIILDVDILDVEDTPSTHNGLALYQFQLSIRQLWLPLWTISPKKASSLWFSTFLML